MCGLLAFKTKYNGGFAKLSKETVCVQWRPPDSRLGCQASSVRGVALKCRPWWLAGWGGWGLPLAPLSSSTAQLLPAAAQPLYAPCALPLCSSLAPAVKQQDHTGYTTQGQRHQKACDEI